MAGVLNLQSYGKSLGFGRTPGEQAFRAESDSFGELAALYAPDVRRSAAAGVQERMKIDANFELGQRLVEDGQRGSLRGGQAAQASHARRQQTQDAICR